jgi:hypothetical protein
MVMEIQFVVNDYLLAWNLLYRGSISQEIHLLKQKLWYNHQKLYRKLNKDNIEILKDLNDFIPDNDTLYNLVFDFNDFDKLKKETNKHRLELMKSWDLNRKRINKELKEIIKFEVMDKYKIIVVHPALDVSEYMGKIKEKNIIWGRRTDLDDRINTLINIIYNIVKYEMAYLEEKDKKIFDTIIALAIKKELHTRISDNSKYVNMEDDILTRQLYPYWLMYLGANKEGMLNYMMRDKIVFDIDRYEVDTFLAKTDLYGFIEYCIKNKDKILNLENFEVI